MLKSYFFVNFLFKMTKYDLNSRRRYCKWYNLVVPYNCTLPWENRMTKYVFDSLGGGIENDTVNGQ